MKKVLFQSLLFFAIMFAAFGFISTVFFRKNSVKIINADYIIFVLSAVILILLVAICVLKKQIKQERRMHGLRIRNLKDNIESEKEEYLNEIHDLRVKNVSSVVTIEQLKHQIKHQVKQYNYAVSLDPEIQGKVERKFNQDTQVSFMCAINEEQDSNEEELEKKKSIKEMSYKQRAESFKKKVEVILKSQCSNKKSYLINLKILLDKYNNLSEDIKKYFDKDLLKQLQQRINEVENKKTNTETHNDRLYVM